jgi:hypothetical protein
VDLEVPMRRQRSKTHPAASQPRPKPKNRKLGGDPYALAKKLPDPSACTGCRAIYRDGRWAWGRPPADARAVLCPACRRAKDDYPGGLVRISGAYAAARRKELERLARNVEAREREEHPLKRILGVRAVEDGALEITTTDPKLARGIGEALRHAHRGKLVAPTRAREGMLRVRWER